LATIRQPASSPTRQGFGSRRQVASALIGFSAVLLTCVSLPTNAYAANTYATKIYKGSSFTTVAEAVFSEPYDTLPQPEVTATALGDDGDVASNHLRVAARRTLSVRDVLIEFPGGKKLFQANGRCFAGH
jgi:hypothetical protein